MFSGMGEGYERGFDEFTFSIYFSKIFDEYLIIYLYILCSA